VSDLIDMDNWSWKMSLIREKIITPDADVILNIWLRIGGGGGDFWSWGLEKSGLYSVKSAYHSKDAQ
jgi:hypothetical protein